MYAAPVSREVVAQDFVDSWNRVTDPKNQSLRLVHPGSGRGLRRRRLPGRHQEGPHRRQGDRRLHARGQAALPVRGVPADAGPHGGRGDPGRVHQQGRRQGVRQEARRHRPVHGRVVEEQPVGPAREEPRLLGHRERGLRRQHQHAHHPRGLRRAGSSSRRALSTTPPCRPGQVARCREQARRSRAASGPPSAGRRWPCTSSAST